MKKRILLAVTLFITAFIFLNSALPADESEMESGFILSIIQHIFAFFHLPDVATDFIIRKLAHFTEFAAFGFFLTLTIEAYRGKLNTELFKILFFLLSVPVADETIQMFSDGRSSEVRDVLIDFGGGIFGLIVAVFWCVMFSIRRNNPSKVNNYI